MLISAWPAYSTIPGVDFVLLLDASWLPLFQDTTDASGFLSRSYALPNQPSLAGLSVYIQAAGLDGFGQLQVSNALEITICP